MEKQVLAVVGVSEDPEKYGNKIFKTLRHAGENAFAVNPKGGMVMGEKVYESLRALPAAPATVILVIPPKFTASVVEEAVRLKAAAIWFQPGSYDAQAADFALKNGVKVYNECFMRVNGFW